jgi:hypothetical protein
MKNSKYPIAKFLYTIGGGFLLFVSGLLILFWIAFELLFPAPKLCVSDILNPKSNPTTPHFSESLELIGHFGGSVQSIFTNNSYAYAGIGSELAVLDISNPSRPQRVGYLVLPDQAQDIFVDGNYAYAATGEWGFRIIDISNPTILREVGSYSTSVPIQEIVVSKGYAYLPLSECKSYGSFLPTRCSGALQIIDVSDPSHPFRVGCHKMSGVPASIVIDGDLAYISEFVSSGVAEARLLTMDISQPKFARVIKIHHFDFGGNLIMNDGYLYISARYDKFRIVDISNPIIYFKTGIYDSRNPSGTRNAIFDAVVFEEHAFLVVEDVGIQVVDISNPAQPALVSTYTVEGEIKDISLIGNHLYIATDINGLQIVNIENPGVLMKTGAYESPKSVTKLEVVNNLLYAASEDSGMRVIDILNPKMPSIVGAYNLPEEMMSITGENEKTYVSGIAVDGNQAYLAVRDLGIQLVDMPNLSEIIEAGFYPIPNGVNDIAVQDNYTYISKGTNTYKAINGIEVIKISPDSLAKINAYTIPSSFNEVAVGDRYVYILGDDGLLTADFSDPSTFIQVGFYESNSRPLGLTLDNRYAYIATSNGLQVVGLSDTGIPTENKPLLLRGLRVEDIVIEEKFAYVATSSGLRVLNISDPLQPVTTGSYLTKTQVTYALVKERNLVYLSTQDEGILIIDVSNPSDLIKVGNYAPPSEIENLAIRGNYAYIVTRNNGLRIIDITNPATPVEIGLIENLERVKDITIRDDYAYVAFRQGLAIIDITDPHKPSTVKQYDITGKVEKITIAGDYAYLSGRGDGLWIINIADLTTPDKIYHYGDLYYETKGIDIQGDFAYVAAGHIGLRILNISNPLKLVEVGFYDDNAVDSSDVAVNSDLAYLTNLASYGANIENDLVVIDVSNPRKPVKLGSYDLPGPVWGVAVDGEYIYIAAGEDGIFIFRYTPP